MCDEQSGETEKIKEFLKDWEDLMSRVPRTEKIVVGADLNGHLRKIQVVFIEEKTVNREGEIILESTEGLDLALN